MRTRHVPALATAALLLGPLLAAPLAATASAGSCPGTEVLFARGTTEPPGLGYVGDAFVSSLRSQLPGNSVGTYAVNYPASFDFMQAAAGANDASEHAQHMVATCPGTRLVLGGYSQGALVIDLVTAGPVPGFDFNRPLPAGVADHIAAVALFGNPSGHLGTLVPGPGPQFASRTIDLCGGDDPVCSGGGDWGAHIQYVQSGMTSQAAAFVAARI